MVFQHRALLFLGGAVLWAAASAGTPAAAQTGDPAGDNDPPIDKRVFGVLPNYRTANASAEYHPLTAAQKFYIGRKDSTDWPIFLLAGAYAGLYQIVDSHPSFGQGMKGYGKRLGTSVVDQTVGNLMTESVMPALLHEDPRYFRRGSGGVLSRVGYAATRIFVTRTDAGSTRFNFSEVLGNAFTAGLGNAYYPDERRLGDNLQRFYMQLGTDSFSQVLKEFWPDIKRRLFQRRAAEPLIRTTP